jgi:hypothetical protein
MNPFKTSSGSQSQLNFYELDGPDTQGSEYDYSAYTGDSQLTGTQTGTQFSLSISQSQSQSFLERRRRRPYDDDEEEDGSEEEELEYDEDISKSKTNEAAGKAQLGGLPDGAGTVISDTNVEGRRCLTRSGFSLTY